jgi:hypothetical protein
MKKLFVSVFLFSILFAWACLPQPEKVESAVGITAPDGYSVACASGYTRIVPHFCADKAFDGTQLVTTSISGLGCQSVSVSSYIPTTSTYLYVLLDISILASNSVANRESRITFHSQASCADSAVDAAYIQIREFVATTANTIIHRQYVPTKIPVVNGTLWYSHSTTGNPITQAVFLIGYYD